MNCILNCHLNERHDTFSHSLQYPILMTSFLSPLLKSRFFASSICPSFLSHRLLKVGTVARSQAFVSKVTEKLISCSTFSCTIIICQSWVYVPFAEFFRLQEWYDMVTRFLHWKQFHPLLFGCFMLHNLLQFVLSAWNVKCVLRERRTQVKWVTWCKKGFVFQRDSRFLYISITLLPTFS